MSEEPKLYYPTIDPATAMGAFSKEAQQAAEIARLRERIVLLQAEVDVLNGTACAEEQARGKGPCGSCRTCRNERIEKLEACVKAADAMRPKVTTLSTYDDKRRVELGASYDLARSALGEVKREG